MKEKWLEKNGFSPEGFTYCVIGDNTFSIKDWLKEQGFKFNPTLKWHTNTQVNLPQGYTLLKLSFDDICEWDDRFKQAFYNERAKEKIQKATAEAMGPSLSEYVGEVGERLRNLTATYKSSRGFAGQYGWTNIHTFEIGDDILVWFTAVDLDHLEKGEPIILTGTVKKHEEFRGVKTTQLSRCIVKEI